MRALSKQHHPSPYVHFSHLSEPILGMPSTTSMAKLTLLTCVPLRCQNLTKVSLVSASPRQYSADLFSSTVYTRYAIIATFFSVVSDFLWNSWTNPRNYLLTPSSFPLHNTSQLMIHLISSRPIPQRTLLSNHTSRSMSLPWPTHLSYIFSPNTTSGILNASHTCSRSAATTSCMEYTFPLNFSSQILSSQSSAPFHAVLTLVSLSLAALPLWTHSIRARWVQYIRNPVDSRLWHFQRKFI